jgi:hypothetical protein
LGLVCWLVAVVRADFATMGELGLVTVLGPIYFVGLALVVVGFVLELLRTPLRPPRLITLVIVLIVFMFGTACAVEPIAGLTVSWVHAGYVLYILNHGHVLNNYNAEFSWPGGFSLGALLVAFTGQSNALGFLRWFPLVIELLYLAPLLAIAKYSGVSRRVGWLGVALFYSANWIYQDYYSPQALNYLLFLVVIAAVLAVWRPDERTIAPIGRAMRERFEKTKTTLSLRRFGGYDATSAVDSSVTLAMLCILSVLCLASAISHQLTPYAIGLALGACLVTRRLGRPELLVLVAMLSVGWLSLGASNFWIGHLSSIFGSFGQFSAIFGQNVTSRVTGSASHRLIVDLRILLTAALFGIAAIGALRRRTTTRALELLAGVPFLILGAQNYGGEGLLRVALFSLPFTSLLAASALMPSRSGPIPAFAPQLRYGRHGLSLLRAGAAAMVFTIAVATVVVRGGNDAYEAYSQGELAAVTYAYAHVVDHQLIGIVAPYLPIGQERIDSSHVISVAAGGSTPTPNMILGGFLSTRPHWIILSKSQESWGEIVGGYSKGWQTTIERSLIRHGYVVAARWPTAVVLRSGRIH